MKIAIIGGGSAGWITLSYLAATIDCELTIIHSNEIDPIGVGESTTPTIKHVADTVGVDEKQWMKDSQATFKYGVEFLNFNNIGSRWVHTFDDMLPHQTFHRPITENGKDLYKKELTSVDYFLKAFGKDVTHYNNTHGPQEYLIENEISPYSKSGKSNISDYPGYSYQINAFKFGESLRMHTDKSKYTEIIDTVTKLNWQGDTIQSVELNNGNKIELSSIFLTQSATILHRSGSISIGYTSSHAQYIHSSPSKSAVNPSIVFLNSTGVFINSTLSPHLSFINSG